MTVLISCHNLTKHFGTTILFKEITLALHRGDKLGIVGPNGSGKSTLMKIISGIDSPDEGSVVVRQGVRVGYVPQVSTYPDEPIDEILAGLLDHHIHSTERHRKAITILSKLGFEDARQPASMLSGGWKKRFDIAKALVLEPDLLLLDEPTNHLDLETINWLEQLIKRAQWSLVLVSHDREFLDRVTNRMIELNRSYPKGLFAVDGSYSTFLERREDFLTHLEQYEQGLRSKVRYETEWLRQSPKARTTKQQARVQQAGQLQDELNTLRRNKKKEISPWQFDEGGHQARKLIAAKNLSLAFSGKTLFKGLDITLSAGSRLGIAGSNGSGKSSLLKVLAGELTPDHGTVKYADGVKLVYFDQHREKLNPSHNVRESLCPQGDTVYFCGKPIHVNGWARRFHFSQERMMLPVAQLSGGERARILLARLMLQPADVLFLDEPTNDLDIDTLEALEESLREFTGAVVLITHDRRMLDNVCDSLIGLGCGDQYSFADIYQWESARKQYLQQHLKQPEITQTKAPQKLISTKAKLTYREQQELSGISEAIEKAEAKLQDISTKVSQETDSTVLSNLCQELDIAQKQVETLYARWEELESKK